MTDGHALNEGDIHDVLRNDRRRFALDELGDNGDSLSVRDLSERVATLETDASPPPRNIRQSVYVSLHQTHLPKLDELGIVEYDADAKRVTLTDRVREVEAFTDRSIGSDSESGPGRRWAWYSIGLSVLGIVAMGVVALDVPAAAAIGAPPIAVVLFAAVLAVSALGLGLRPGAFGQDRNAGRGRS